MKLNLKIWKIVDLFISLNEDDNGVAKQALDREMSMYGNRGCNSSLKEKC